MYHIFTAVCIAALAWFFYRIWKGHLQLQEESKPEEVALIPHPLTSAYQSALSQYRLGIIAEEELKEIEEHFISVTGDLDGEKA